MTVDEVRARVEAIRRLADDDERAHAEEDRLHQDVLEVIARTDTADAQKLAHEALMTRTIDFLRHCA